MSKAGGDSGNITNNRSLTGGDIESGVRCRYVSDIERMSFPIEGYLEMVENGPNNYGHDEDVDNWAGSLAKILDDVPQYMCSSGHPGRVSKIPENLREIDMKAYEPYFVSVGPYHHGKKSVEQMDKRKRIVLKGFLKVKPELDLKIYLEELKSLEPEARKFYADIEMDSQKFMQMLLLDSLFVLSLFCGMPLNRERRTRTNTQIAHSVDLEVTTERTEQINQCMRSGNDNGNTEIAPMAEQSYYVTESQDDETPRVFSGLLSHDLFLLENQLPFFILQKIYVLAYGGSDKQLTLIVKDAVGNMLSDYTKLDSEITISPTEEIHHLLHFAHLFFRPLLPNESTTCQRPESSGLFRLGSAVQLYEAGVSFVARSGSSRHSLLDITFNSSGNMVMPCLAVDDNTNSLLRNLIALEQMKYPTLGLNVSAYAVLLLHLVTTPEDAQLLRRKGIIQHHLASDKEMMHLVNKLSVGLSFDYVEDIYSLKPVFQELKRYTERRRPGWKAWLKHRYFNNPWTTISLVAASILLLLTVVQTYFTVYSYYFPCDGCYS